MKSLIYVCSLDSQPHLSFLVVKTQCGRMALSWLYIVMLMEQKKLNWTISSVHHIWLEHNNILYISAMDSVTFIPQGYLKALSLCNKNTITIPHEASLRFSSSVQTLSVSLYFTFQGPWSSVILTSSLYHWQYLR